MSDFLPCPSCGSAENLRRGLPVWHERWLRSGVICQCGMNATSVERWNTRALPAVQPNAREAALREALAAVNAKWRSGADTPDEMRGLALAEAAILDLIDKPGHVNETPKSEHDTANMLTLTAERDRLREALRDGRRLWEIARDDRIRLLIQLEQCEASHE